MKNNLMRVIQKGWVLVTVVSVTVGSFGACGNSDDNANLSATVGTSGQTADTQITVEEESVPVNSGSGGSAPVINSRKHDMIFTSDPSKIDMNDLLDYSDDGECTVSLWGFNKEEDARKLPDDVTVSLAEALLTRYDDTALTSRPKGDVPTAEGIYTAVCSVTDAGGNEAHTPIVVVIDTSPAQANDIDQMKQQVNTEEELEGRLQNIHVVDNVDGDIPIDKVGHEIVVPQGGGSYQLVITYTDRAGNKMEQAVELSVGGAFSVAAPAQNNSQDQAGNANGQGQDAQTTPSANAQPDNSNSASVPNDQPQPSSTASSSLSVPSVPQGAGFRNDYSDQVLALINEQRASAGLAPLVMNASAQQAAGIRASELVSTFSHTRPDGSSCYTILDQAGIGYGVAGENIAAGQNSASSVMNSWMNSVGHRDNILNAGYSQVGIACYYDPSSPYTYYWVQLFIG